MNVPKLRFPEFKEEWEEKHFSNFLTPKFRDVPKPNQNYLAIGVRSHGRGTFQKPDSDPTKIAMEKLFIVRENDLVVNITFAWEGAIAIIQQKDDGGLVSHRFPTYEFNDNLVIHDFFSLVIENKRFRKKLELISPGGAGRNRVMSKPEFLKIIHVFPKLEEQKKIASFFKAINSKLEKLRRKRDLLKKYKRGLMQKLFTRKLRFTDANSQSFPDWKEKRLEEVAVLAKGKGISKVDIVKDGVLPCIHYGELYTKYAEIIDTIQSRTNIPADELTLSEAMNVIIPASGEDKLDMARASCVTSSGIALGGDLNIIQIIRSELNGRFLAYYLSHGKRKAIARLAQGNSVVHLYGTQLRQLEISIPHPDEQQKIADALSNMDAKITAVSDQVEKLEKFKKGLLQQMFV